jgi:hypothetical protein
MGQGVADDARAGGRPIEGDCESCGTFEEPADKRPRRLSCLLGVGPEMTSVGEDQTV